MSSNLSIRMTNSDNLTNGGGGAIVRHLTKQCKRLHARPVGTLAPGTLAPSPDRQRPLYPVARDVFVVRARTYRVVEGCAARRHAYVECSEESAALVVCEREHHVVGEPVCTQCVGHRRFTTALKVSHVDGSDLVPTLSALECGAE